MVSSIVIPRRVRGIHCVDYPHKAGNDGCLWGLRSILYRDTFFFQ